MICTENKKYIGTSSVLCGSFGKRSGKTLAVGFEDFSVAVYQLTKNEPLLVLKKHYAPVKCVLYDRNEENLFTSTSDGIIRSWHLETGQVTMTLLDPNVLHTCIDNHPYSHFFVNGSECGLLKLWDIRNKSAVQTYRAHSSAVSTIRFSLDGQLVASGSSDGSVKLWDLKAGKMLCQLTSHEECVNSVLFHPSESTIISAGNEGKIQLYDYNLARVQSTVVDPATFHLAIFESSLFASSVYGLSKFSMENSVVVKTHQQNFIKRASPLLKVIDVMFVPTTNHIATAGLTENNVVQLYFHDLNLKNQQENAIPENNVMQKNTCSLSSMPPKAPASGVSDDTADFISHVECLKQSSLEMQNALLSRLASMKKVLSMWSEGHHSYALKLLKSLDHVVVVDILCALPLSDFDFDLYEQIFDNILQLMKDPSESTLRAVCLVMRKFLDCYNELAAPVSVYARLSFKEERNVKLKKSNDFLFAVKDAFELVRTKSASYTIISREILKDIDMICRKL